jgi:endonuclease G, mitochondrial
MKQLTNLLLLMSLILSTACAQKEAKTSNGETVILYNDHTWAYKDSLIADTIFRHIVNLEIPKINENDIIISHSGFSLLYNEEHEQASWVAYFLTKERAQKGTERTNNFKPDPKVSTLTANDKDYAASGFDRGHLAPAGDMTWSSETMAESFYYSNMSPQVPSFNRGIWKKLEDQVRTWAKTYDSLYIVTGPILEDGLPTIGDNKVSIPRIYYKAILRYRNNDISSIGFLIPNKGLNEPLQNFTVTIDSLENLTEIDFFHLLPDYLEESVEKTICIDCWSWKGKKSENTPQ